MDEGLSYQAPPQQLPAAQPPQPSNPPRGAHPLSSGPQPGTAPATQHSQAGSASGQAYGQHGYSEPAKPKKGQQLWNRMKREWPWAVEGRGRYRTSGARHVGCLDRASLLGPPGAVRGAARNGRPSLELRAPAPGVGAGPPT